MKKTMLSIMILLSLSTLANGKEEKHLTKDFSLTFTDVVYKIQPDDKDLKILFKKRAAIYYLKHNSKNFEALKNSLDQSKNKDEPIVVRIDGNSMEILEQAQSED